MNALMNVNSSANGITNEESKMTVECFRRQVSRYAVLNVNFLVADLMTLNSTIGFLSLFRFGELHNRKSNWLVFLSSHLQQSDADTDSYLDLTTLSWHSVHLHVCMYVHIWILVQHSSRISRTSRSMVI